LAINESKNDSLKKIKLSKNKLTDKTAFALKNLFATSNVNIEVLDLSWNKIWQPGGCAIADFLKKDAKSLRILDLSWNCLSKRPPLNFKDQ